jgi:anion transporter
MGSFTSLHDHLLMLNPTMGCGFFAKPGSACQYCQYDSMLNATMPPIRDALEIIEVVRAALAEREIDTVYLYNGYAPDADVGLRRYVPLIALLRKHLGHRQIALETVAPEDLTVIDELYEAGLDIFVCNLEVADEKRFEEVCPGKAKLGGQERIWRALDYAKGIFRSGTVVSHLIVGLESMPSTIAGMERLIKAGIVPLLVPFRPLPGTPLQERSLPSLDDVEQALLIQSKLLIGSQLPTHRLRDMGRVLTPMESRVLDGVEPSLQQKFVVSSFGRWLEGWFDGLRRHVHMSGKNASDHDGGRQQTTSLLFRQGTPFALLVIIALSTAVLVQLDAPDGLSEQGWHSLIVFGLCLVLWVSQLLPLSVTSLLGLALLPVFGVFPAADVFSLFGNPAVFFILGAFMLAAGVIKTGLSEHLALFVLERMGSTPRRLLVAMLLLPAAMATFMPEHAVVAVMLPIAWEVVRSLGLSSEQRYAQAIFFALAWGAVIGGVATLLGGARGPLALGLIEELTGQTFTFIQWTEAALPLVLVMLAVALMQLLYATAGLRIDISEAQNRIELNRLTLGVLAWPGRAMGLLLAGTVIAWVFGGHATGLATISLISVVLMFALRLVRWSDVESHVNWGVVFMYGGAIAIGKALAVTGAGEWLATLLLPDGVSPFGLIILLTAATLLLTECVSNAAAVAIILPVAIPLGLVAGIDPITVALAVGIISGFAFILPMGTPPNAMIYATGFVQFRSMVRYGSRLSLSAFVLFLVVAWLWWPIIDRGI